VALGRLPEAREHLRAVVDLEGETAVARFRQARELLGLAIPESAPRGFEVQGDARVTLVAKPAVADALCERRPAPGGEPPKAGRAPMERIALPDGVALVRRSRRGGLLGRLLGGCYLDGSRFLRELAVAEALFHRGVPTPEPLGGVRREGLPGVYRMEVITREVAGARDLAAALRTLPSGEEGPRRKAALLRAAARLVRQCHDAGLRHPDLNARNILIAPDGTAMVLDLDRAELVDDLRFRDRAAALARLYRSLHKLGLAPLPVGEDDWATFLAEYAAGDPALEAKRPAVLARCRRELAWHRLGWKNG
jgi:3-deoxy-D-manno-octulosonic acid kinase